MKIGQLCFFRLSSPAEYPYGSAKYGSRYQGQRGPTPSKSHPTFTARPSEARTRMHAIEFVAPRRPYQRGDLLVLVADVRTAPGVCRVEKPRDRIVM